MLAQVLHDSLAILCCHFRISLFDDGIGFGFGQLQQFAIADQIGYP